MSHSHKLLEIPIKNDVLTEIQFSLPVNQLLRCCWHTLVASKGGANALQSVLALSWISHQCPLCHHKVLIARVARLCGDLTQT